MTLTVYRRAQFNAAHRLYNPDWTDAKNKKVFGKCANPNYHGHNYVLEVGVSGKVDPITGYLIDIELLKTYIKEEVEIPFDHKNLNLEVPEFTRLNPTMENIIQVLFKRLRKRLDITYTLSLKLYETPRNFVTYTE